MLFKFEAIDSTGGTIMDTIRATDRLEATAKIRARGVFPRLVEPVIEPDASPKRLGENQLTEQEKAINIAIDVVEQAGQHELLTEAVCLLKDARNKVAGWADSEVHRG